eukprot:358287-Chlamydomonas_euryale.AAC.20
MHTTERAGRGARGGQAHGRAEGGHLPNAGRHMARGRPTHAGASRSSRLCVDVRKVALGRRRGLLPPAAQVLSCAVQDAWISMVRRRVWLWQIYGKRASHMAKTGQPNARQANQTSMSSAKFSLQVLINNILWWSIPWRRYGLSRTNVRLTPFLASNPL